MFKCPGSAIAIGIATTFFAPIPSAAAPLQAPPQNIAVSVQPGSQSQSGIVPDGDGGAIILWSDYRSPDNIRLRAQRISAEGELLWPGEGVEVARLGDYADGGVPMSDGAGGVFVVWARRVGGVYPGGELDLFAQHLGAQGQKLWAVEGVPVCTAREFQAGLDLTSDGAGGVIVSWEDHRELFIGGTAQSDIYAQRLDATGRALWAENGVLVCTADGTQHSPRLVSDDAGGAFVVWADYRSRFGDIYAQRIGPGGGLLWDPEGVPLCVGCHNTGYVLVVRDGAGGAIALWHDGRDLSHPQLLNVSIFAQRALSSGSVAWPANGVPVSTGIGQVLTMNAIPDNAGGAIVAWQHAPGPFGTTNLLSQHISGAGLPLWSVDGVVFGSSRSDEGSPNLATDGAGGAFVTWWEDSTVFARRISKGGALVGPGAQDISTTTGRNVHPTICADASSGAFVAWTELRLDDDPYTTLPWLGDVFAEHLRRNARPSMASGAQPLGAPAELSTQEGMIQFSLQEARRIAIRIFDTSGRCIRSLDPTEFAAGTHRVAVPKTDNGGAKLRPGVYFYQVTGTSRLERGRFVVLR